jgi:hypothetical protein
MCSASFHGGFHLVLSDASPVSNLQANADQRGPPEGRRGKQLSESALLLPAALFNLFNLGLQMGRGERRRTIGSS